MPKGWRLWLLIGLWGILSDPVSSVVAPTYFRCGIFSIGLATASAEGKSRVAYQSTFLASFARSGIPSTSRPLRLQMRQQPTSSAKPRPLPAPQISWHRGLLVENLLRPLPRLGHASL